MTSRELTDKLATLGEWYGDINLGEIGVWTPSKMLAGQRTAWDGVRNVRTAIDYAGKSVLDLGSLDGMWAFEAEELGASTVIASDVYQMAGAEMFERFCFAKTCRSSKAAMIPNADIHDLPNRMRSVMRAWGVQKGFDIIQCLGLLYHIQNPLLGLQQMRRCCAPGAVVLIETACTEETQSALRFNFNKGFYNDEVTYWIPSQSCLMDMLALSGFIVRLHSVSRIRADRVCLIADAGEFTDREERFG